MQITQVDIDPQDYLIRNYRYTFSYSDHGFIVGLNLYPLMHNIIHGIPNSLLTVS